MKRIVEKFFNKKNLLSKDETFIVGFSGGFDSMALANILIELSWEYGFKVVLAHLNHNWRGAKSNAEAKNCEKFAKANNVEFYTETLLEDLPHTETVARQERYAFFERAAKKYESSVIVTAHTKSDNIETVLQRIIKGTAISGLTGIPDTRDIICAKVYRPLLKCTRAEILEYCKHHNLKPNNDNSNSDTKYLRNRIRVKLLPELKKNYDENIENAIARLIQNAIDSEKIIEEFSRRELVNLFEEDVISTKEFLKLSSAMKKRVIKENILENNGFDFDQKRINNVLDFIESAASSKAGKTFSLAQNQWLYTNHKITEIIDEERYNSIFVQKEINMEGETYLEEFNAVVRISKWEGDAPTEFPKDTDNVVYADLSDVEFPLILRPRIYGDKIVPFGKNSPIKLKKYLNNKKLSKHDKSKVLLISSPKEVLWVINLGISNSIRVNGMPTHKLEFFYKE